MVTNEIRITKEVITIIDRIRINPLITNQDKGMVIIIITINLEESIIPMPVGVETIDIIIKEEEASHTSTIISITATGMKAVSYTHLDVYKRQFIHSL